MNNEDILKFAKLFSDEITLDNISRPQLVAMCKYMGLSSYGSDAMLRYRLRNRIRQIQADDKVTPFPIKHLINKLVDSLGRRELPLT